VLANLLRVLEDVFGDFGTATVALLVPVVFFQSWGFYMVGNELFRRRGWAVLYALLHIPLVWIRFPQGTHWGIYEDPWARHLYQAALPFLWWLSSFIPTVHLGVKAVVAWLAACRPLTLYGQFDVSLLDELPFEKDVRTYWVSEDRRDEVYRLVADEIKQRGVQAYVVLPLIEESEELDLKAAVQVKEELEATVFRGLRVGLLHGRMRDEEKRRVMAQVQNKELDVLVSTSIIEVGIDVPDASIMVIEHADRFGLSQLHQLRGRIGRQGQRALCFALASPKTEDGRRRLEAFRDLSDGFAIAEEDLRIRGPGELLGTAQHGLDTTFKVADLIKDLPLMKAAREEAFRLLEEDPNTPLIREFRRRFGDKFELARV